MLSHYLAGVFALSTATAFIFPPATTKADPPDPTVKQLLEDIRTQVTGTRNDIAGLKDRVESLDRQIEAIKLAMVPTTEHEKLKRQLEQLKLEVDALRAQLNGSRPTVAGSSPLPAGPGGPSMTRPIATTGTLRVTNRNFFDSEVFVNGTGYVIIARSSADIPVPAGAFLHLVPALMPGPVNRMMPAGQVFGITIYQ